MFCNFNLNFKSSSFRSCPQVQYVYAILRGEKICKDHVPLFFFLLLWQGQSLGSKSSGCTGSNLSVLCLLPGSRASDLHCGSAHPLTGRHTHIYISTFGPWKGVSPLYAYIIQMGRTVHVIHVKHVRESSTFSMSPDGGVSYCLIIFHS